MRNCVLFSMILLLGLSTVADAKKKHRRQAGGSLVLHDGNDAAINLGAKLDSGMPAPMAQNRSPTFMESHSARVANDFMLFQPTLIGVVPASRNRPADLVAHGQVKAEGKFFAPPAAADPLEVSRERDRLLLPGGRQPQGAAVGFGLVMFSAATIMSAHAPHKLRALFDGPVHLGPAIFDGGGMGAGVAGRVF